MRPQRATVLLLVGLTLGCEPPAPSPTPGPTPTPGPGQPPPGAYDCAAAAEVTGYHKAEEPTGRHIVWLKRSDLSASSRREVAQAYGATEVVTHSRGFTAKLPDVGVSSLRSDPNVQAVFEEGTKHIPKPIPAIRSIRLQAVGSTGQDRIDQRDQPLNGIYSTLDGATGAGVKVVITDTGVTSVPAEFTLAPDCFTTVAGGCADANGHGTWCAGKVGSKTWGGAPGTTIYAARFLDANGSGTDTDAVRAIEWAIAKAGADPGPWINSNSWGGGRSVPVDDAMCRARAAGIAVFAAAGNDGEDASLTSPSRVWQIATVYATNARTDRAPTWTNFGPVTNFGFPGEDEASTCRDGGTCFSSGTSMSTPLAAAVAAVVWQRHPSWIADEVIKWIADHATPGKVTQLRGKTPNLLGYVRED